MYLQKVLFNSGLPSNFQYSFLIVRALLQVPSNSISSFSLEKRNKANCPLSDLFKFLRKETA